MMGEKSCGLIIAKNHGIRRKRAGNSMVNQKNWKQKSKHDGQAYQITVEETHEPSTNLDAIPFTKE